MAKSSKKSSKTTRDKNVGICFKYTSNIHLRDLWLLNIRAFDVQAWERGIAENEIMSDDIVGIKNIKDLPEDIPLVVITPKDGEYVKGKTAIPEFKHPKKVIYYFGPDDDHLKKEELGDRKYKTVYIPISEKGESLWSPQSGSIVLYDRMLKEKYGYSR